MRDALDKTTKGGIGHLQDSGGAGLEGKLRRALSLYESTGGYLLRMDLIEALEDGLGLAIDNDLAQVGGYQFGHSMDYIYNSLHRADYILSMYRCYYCKHSIIV